MNCPEIRRVVRAQRSMRIDPRIIVPVIDTTLERLACVRAAWPQRRSA